jgi:hypothetical protein
MEGTKHILDPIHLQNGLSVHFDDQTTPPVAGRCQVRLLIRVPMEPETDHFQTYPDPSQALAEFISLAGNGPVEFQVEKVRNFIDSREVLQHLEAMKDEFARSNLMYLQKPAFAAGYIRKKYEELRESKSVSKQ